MYEMARKTNKEDPTQSKCGHGMMTTAVIGPRGQIVIPKEAREWMQIKPGDQIVLMSKMSGVMVMMRSDRVRELANHLLSKIK